MRAILVYVALAFLGATLPANASWLSEITGIDVDLNRGTVDVRPPNPTAIVPMIENLPKDVGQAMLNPAAPALATAIRFSRGQALNRGAQPIPTAVVQRLSPYFPSWLLQKVRWTTADGVSIDGALSNWFSQEGAVTFDEVIVFSDAALTNNIELWAHELTHVLQYSQMGVETFAFQYSIDWNSLETQAAQNASGIAGSIRSAASGSGSTWSAALVGGIREEQPTPIEWADINQMAVRAIDPITCIWINAQSNTTGNSCPTTIRVTGVIIRRLQDGFTFQYPCNEPTCVFQPNQSGPLLSPMGHQIVGVTAAYEGF